MKDTRSAKHANTETNYESFDSLEFRIGLE